LAPVLTDGLGGISLMNFEAGLRILGIEPDADLMSQVVFLVGEIIDGRSKDSN
jgi:hypothetical protein